MQDKIELKKISDVSTIHSLLITAKDAGCEVFLWRIIGNSKHMARVKIDSIRKSRKDICVSPVQGERTSVEGIIGSYQTVDVYIPESSLLFRCNIKQCEAPERYYLEIPITAAQVDRRKYLRLNVHGNNEVKVQFSKSMMESKSIQQHFSKGCFDISAGGFSFYISRTEVKYFKVNDPIRSVLLCAGDWAGKIDVEIALIKEIEPNESNGLTYKAWRVSCRFKNFDQISRKYLEKFIFERIKNDVHAINE